MIIIDISCQLVCIRIVAMSDIDKRIIDTIGTIDGGKRLKSTNHSKGIA